MLYILPYNTERSTNGIITKEYLEENTHDQKIIPYMYNMYIVKLVNAMEQGWTVCYMYMCMPSLK